MQQRYFIGESSIEELAPIIKEYAPEGILLVRGKNSYRESGAEKNLQAILSSFDLRIVEYFDFSVNPKIEDVQKGLELLYLNSIDTIIGIGGGSVLDMAKLIRFFYSFESDIDHNTYLFKRELIPLITIPTTAGSGSEATHFAVVYRNNVKYSVAHRQLLSDVTIVDPYFTYKNSSYLTACTGFDALSQAIESFWSCNATLESLGFAKKAIQLLWKNLPVLVKNPDDITRRQYVAEGAFWAGKAINISKTTAPHALSYPFTTYYRYPHGHAVALSLPFFMYYNYTNDVSQLNAPLELSAFQNRMNELYEILGIKDASDAFEMMSGYVRQLFGDLKEPDDYDSQIVLNNINLQRASNNPRILNNEDMLFLTRYIYSPEYIKKMIIDDDTKRD